MSNIYETSTTGANPIELCIKDDHDTISAYVREHGIVHRSEHISAFNTNTTNTTTRTLRCWKKDYEIAEAFCEKYGMCYGEIVYESAKYNIFFNDVDGDEVECCLSENTGDLSDKPCVKYTDILLYIPLNERNLHTDIETELLKFCRAKGIIEKA
jgi:hypothetical protein